MWRLTGKSCVMELLREFDEENFIDLSGEEKLLSHINNYYEKTYTDIMTGIYNRRFYEEKLKNSTLTAGVAMIDLDDFKVYNDVYGHAAGDTVLTAFAAEIRKDIRCLRQSHPLWRRRVFVSHAGRSRRQL